MTARRVSRARTRARACGSVAVTVTVGPVSLTWLIRLRRGPRQVVIATGLGRPSADHLATQIDNVINPPPLASPAPTR